MKSRLEGRLPDGPQQSLALSKTTSSGGSCRTRSLSSSVLSTLPSGNLRLRLSSVAL